MKASTVSVQCHGVPSVCGIVLDFSQYNVRSVCVIGLDFAASAGADARWLSARPLLRDAWS
eukprot:1386651-Rhodomonas_salina.5